ncbi:MerR family transcriptional regulator, redox-sensitive transcriptional activator SoxR [Prauserella marina]|uniref:MerR family transcriptional regulator, redox-sensitive transcriptional activator SoxR n=1 Tax=Prauserella marina TaxID=530584 RepID=A0A1G6IM74_9PSEU|nr:redox-sensitive transcriptional activator SoxR [Prauserella marina]PWV84982.1 MerR family redox-sensitive transcriptional activator SoxR [Prauserella marina]SDC07672.1 MerR family transcriptional regulator, redox-sensitive transcriptional activator SoxR [Prauserella marina]
MPARRNDVTSGPVRHIDPSEPLAIGEVISRTGVSASALHFYERKGLISSERTSANQRLYPRHMLRRISLVLVAKRLGIPLTDVANIFAGLPDDHAPTHQDWQRVSRSWKRQLEERRRQLETLEHELTGCIGCGCLSMRACLLLNPDDALSTQGPGPVRIQGLASGEPTQGQSGAPSSR